MSVPPLFGLILAGGASTRMQRDKAALAYHGRSQLSWAYDLVSQACAATFVSVRPDQREEPTRAGFPQIVDRQPGIGPIAGISAALSQHPKAAWLIVACDLPFLTRGILDHLVAHRDATSIATAYRSSHDGLPEPLFAIWEPAARDLVQAHIDAGKQCPRKFLINANARLLDLPDPRVLDNVNTASEYESASRILTGAHASEPRSGTIGIRVQYFALFREQAGRSEEPLRTTAATPAQLYSELQTRHPFRLAPQQLKVAINSEFADWNAPLRDGDIIVFIPPVAGG